MQDRYVGDIGDFVKYGLLRALGEGKRLGVAWYLHPDYDGDGRHTGYLRKPKDWRYLDPELFDTLKKLVDLIDEDRENSRKPKDWRHLDPELFDTLKKLVDLVDEDRENRRSVAEIQRSGILGHAVFADEPLNNVNGVAVRDRERQRREWFERVKYTLSDCDLVFADPDKGLCLDDGFKPTIKKNAERIPLCEALALAEDRPAVIYHHNSRHRGGHREEIQEWMDRLPSPVHAYYWRRRSNRTFFVINPDSEIERRLEKFAERWGCHGELIRG